MKKCVSISILLLLLCKIAFAQQQYITIRKDAKWGLINTNGKEVLPLIYDSFTYNLLEDFAICKKNNNTSVINISTKNIIIAERNWNYITFQNSQFKAYIGDSCFVFDLNGKVNLAEKSTDLSIVKDSIYVFKNHNLIKLVNVESGKSVTDSSYNFIVDYNFLINKVNNKNEHRILDLSLNQVALIHDNINEIISHDNDILIYKNILKNYVFYNTETKSVIGEAYYTTYKSWGSNNAYYKLNNHKGSFLLSLKTKLLEKAPPYDTIVEERDRFIIIRENNKYGLVDSLYKIILPIENEDVNFLTLPLISVKNKDKFAIFNIKNKKLSAYQYDEIYETENNLIIYSIGNKKGLLTSKGGEVTKAIYDEIYVEESSVELIIDGKKETRLINSKGQFVEKLENIHEFVIKQKYKPRATWDTNNNLPRNWNKCNCHSLVINLTTKNKVKKAPYINPHHHYWGFQTYILYDTCKGIFDAKHYFKKALICDFKTSEIISIQKSNFDYAYLDRNYELINSLSFFKDTKKVKEPILYSSEFNNGKSAVCVGQVHKNSKMDVYKEKEHYYFLKNAFVKEIKWGFMDTNGNLAITPKYVDVKAFNQYSAIVAIENPNLAKNKLWGLISQNDENLLPNEYRDIVQINDSILRLYKDRKDFKLTNSKLNYITTNTFDQVNTESENKWAVQKNNKWTFVNAHGRLISPYIFDKATAFSQGLAGVKQGKKWGYIDSSGTMAIKPNFNFVDNFHSGRAFVKRGSGFEIIDNLGNIVSKQKFAHYVPFYRHISFAKLHRKKYKIIDLNGNYISKKKFKSVSKFNAYLTAIVKKNRRKEFLIDTIGKRISSKYKKINQYSNHLALVKRNGHFGYIDTLGKEKIKVKFKHALSFSENKAVVYETVILKNLKKARVYNIIDTAGNYLTNNISLLNDNFDNKAIRDSILSIKYFPFSENYSILTTQNKIIVIDGEFNILFKTNIEQNVTKFEPFRGGVAIVNQNIVVANNYVKTMDYFNRITHLTDSLLLTTTSVGLVGIINYNLDEILKPLYRNISLENNGMFKLQLNQTVGMATNKGDIKIPCEYDQIEAVSTAPSYIYVHSALNMSCAQNDGKWIYHYK